MRYAYTINERRKLLEQILIPPLIGAVYPNLISKDIVWVYPLWCLRVEDEKEENEGCSRQGQVGRDRA